MQKGRNSSWKSLWPLPTSTSPGQKHCSVNVLLCCKPNKQLHLPYVVQTSSEEFASFCTSLQKSAYTTHLFSTLFCFSWKNLQKWFLLSSLSTSSDAPGNMPNSWYVGYWWVHISYEFSKQDYWNDEVLHKHDWYYQHPDFLPLSNAHCLVKHWFLVLILLYADHYCLDDFEVQIQHMTEKGKDATYESNQSGMHPYASAIFTCHWGVFKEFLKLIAEIHTLLRIAQLYKNIINYL